MNITGSQPISGRSMPTWARVGMAAALIPSILVFLVLWIFPAPLKAGDDHAAMAVRGFANMWFAGMTAAENPGLLTDFAGYGLAMKARFGMTFPEHSWGYPPSMLLVATPFGAMPLLASFIVWTLLGIIAFALALRIRPEQSGLPRSVAMACALAPALWCCSLSGQTGAFAGALLIGGMLLYPHSPLKGGVMLGMLALKPQMGFLLPVHLVAAGRWRTLLWAGITALAMAALSAIIWGLDAWRDFFALTGPRMTGILQRPWNANPAQTDITSPFMSMRAMGFTLTAAWSVQAVIAAFCMTMCWWASRQMNRLAGMGHEARLVGIALVIGLDLLSVPYSHDYDMPAMAVAVAILFRDCLRRGGDGAWDMPLLGLAWTWPGAMVLWAAGNPDMTPLSPLLGTISLMSVVFVGYRRLSMPGWPLAPAWDSTTGVAPVEHATGR